MGTTDFKEYQEKIDNYAQKAAQKMGRGKFIKKYSEDNSEYSSNELCTKIFEKIAREGKNSDLDW